NSLSVKTASHSSVVEAFRARKSGGLDSKSRLIQSPAPAPNPSDSTSNQTNGTTQNSSGYSIQLNGSPLDASGLAQSMAVAVTQKAESKNLRHDWLAGRWGFRAHQAA